MKFRCVVLLVLAVGSGCAFDTRSVAPRGLGGSGGSGAHGGSGAQGGAGAQGGDGGEGGGATGGVGGQVEPDCLPGTERSVCDGNSCHPVSLVCTSMALESRGPCESCYSDSNCAALDHRCVKMTYDGFDHPDAMTGFCLQLIKEGTECAPPFVVVLEGAESMSGGSPGDYCGIQQGLTTCDAVRAFHEGAVCASGRDDECNPGGICRPAANRGNQTELRCTYTCVDALECSTLSESIECAGYCGGATGS